MNIDCCRTPTLHWWLCWHHRCDLELWEPGGIPRLFRTYRAFQVRQRVWDGKMWVLKKQTSTNGL